MYVFTELTCQIVHSDAMRWGVLELRRLHVGLSFGDLRQHEGLQGDDGRLLTGHLRRRYKILGLPSKIVSSSSSYLPTNKTCNNMTFLIGCKPKKPCPEGQVYSNNSLTECVPRAKCRPVCMTLPDGRELFEGDIIEQDECHTCRCSKEERVCTGQPCSTAAVRS